MEINGNIIIWAAVALSFLIAFFCLKYKDARNKHPWLYLILGFIALLTGLRRLGDDILNVW